MNTVTVKINGVEYNLRGKEDEKYLFDVADYVDGKIREISVNNKKLSISSVAVLTAVNIADELFKCDLEINDITKKKNSLEERHLTLKERLRELKNEIEETSKARTTEVESLKNIIFSMEDKLREFDEMKNTNETLKKKVSELTKEVELDKSEIEDLKNELKNTRDENDKLEKIVGNYTEELNNKVSIEEYEKVEKSLKETQKANTLLSDENEDLKIKIDEYSKKIEVIKNDKDTLAQIEEELRQSISIKEIELMETRNNLIKANNEETSLLKNKISTIEKQLEDTAKKKELFSARNKEIGFKLQNYKYKVLDLEKKLMDAQFNLAIEKKDKNPLLR